MRIGIFGGSFDPVHLEHIALARTAVKDLSLDKLFVLPAFIPPHKRGKTLTGGEMRLSLCRLAFSDVDKAEVSDFEMREGGTSYSYLTVRHFKSEYPNAELFFLVGTDMLRDFPSWKNPEDILENATLAVCARAEETGWEEREQQAFYARFRKKFAVIGYDGKKVSSTEIRVLAGAGEEITHLTGGKVASFIKEHGLYGIEGAKEALSYEKQTRKEHSIRVAICCAEKANELKIDEKSAITAGLFHDCAKNLTADSPFLRGFVCPKGVPESVWHQYAGAYVAEHIYKIKNEDVLNAVRYHTSGRAGMSELEKLVFLADMVEDGRTYNGVERIREKFRASKETLDSCMLYALNEMLTFLLIKNAEIYPETEKAYMYFKNKLKGE